MQGHSLCMEVCIHLRMCHSNDILLWLRNMKVTFDLFYNMEGLLQYLVRNHHLSTPENLTVTTNIVFKKQLTY